MRERRRKFTPEFKDEAAKMVTESSRPIAEVAREIQVNEGTLGSWVNKYRITSTRNHRCRSRSGLVFESSNEKYVS
jgi:transposase-like protein